MRRVRVIRLLPFVHFRAIGIPVLLSLLVGFFFVSVLPPLKALNPVCQPVYSSKAVVRASYQTEVSIAKAKSLYLTMDLSGMALILKARGVVLREFPFQALDFIGESPSTLAVFSLNSKYPLVEPVPIMVPPSGDFSLSPTVEAKPLLVSDMPTQYTVAWDGRFTLVIQGAKASSMLGKTLEETGAWLNRQAARMSNWGAHLLGGPASHFVLHMTTEDAQALYWALVPPMKILVVPQSC